MIKSNGKPLSHAMSRLGLVWVVIAAVTAFPGNGAPENSKQSATSYLCIADKTIGLVFDTGSRTWNENALELPRKYLFQSRDGSWTAKHFGDPPKLTRTCVEQFGVLRCPSSYLVYGGELTMDRSSKRFIYFSAGTFLAGVYESLSDPPIMQVGRCEPI